MNGIWLGFGFGAAIGLLGGMVLMHNCRCVRERVSEMQDKMVDKYEAKKKELLEKSEAMMVIDTEIVDQPDSKAKKK